MARVVWFAKALPRVWLEAGGRVAVVGAPTAPGRVSMELRSAAGSPRRGSGVIPHCRLLVYKGTPHAKHSGARRNDHAALVQAKSPRT